MDRMYESEAGMAYEVEFWGSRKELGNDDHWTSWTAGTEEEALAILADPLSVMPRMGPDQWAHAYVEGPQGRVAERANPDYREAPDDDSAPRSEAAMQAGMAHGLDGYNEVLGQDVEEDGGYRP